MYYKVPVKVNYVQERQGDHEEVKQAIDKHFNQKSESRDVLEAVERASDKKKVQEIVDVLMPLVNTKKVDSYEPDAEIKGPYSAMRVDEKTFLVKTVLPQPHLEAEKTLARDKVTASLERMTIIEPQEVKNRRVVMESALRDDPAAERA